MIKTNLLRTILCFILITSNLCTAQNKNKKEIEKKIEVLLSKMTLEEKVIQLNSCDPNGNARLGIPQMSIGEALHGIWFNGATSFPQAIGLGATWDPEIIKEMGIVIGKEGRAVGSHHVYSPTLALGRDSRWGRIEESYGEDPHHVSRMGVAFIQGVQGMGDERFGPNKMICAPKHFVGDGQSLRGGNGLEVEVSETTFRENDLMPFEAAVKEAKVGSLMPAHHTVNRVPCHANKWLLQTVLRDEWGFDGFTVSDNVDIVKLYKLSDIEGHFLASSKKDAARLALEAGVDTELAMGAGWSSKNRTYGASLVEAVNEGLIPVALIDRSVRRVLRAKFELGLFNQPELSKVDRIRGNIDLPEENTVDYDPWAEAIKNGTGIKTYKTKRANWKEVLADKSHEALALKIAQKSIVLLKNENNLLPLSKGKLKKIAVIGPNANAKVLGGYSGNPRYFVTVLDGIKKRVGKDVEVTYAKGCDILPSDSDKDNIPKAVAVAEKADLTVVVVGTNTKVLVENTDRPKVELTGRQEELVMALHAIGKPVVVVLINGGPLAIPNIKEKLPAIVEGWYGGQETGTAIAQVLFGDINPGGKLAVTFPYSTGMVPCFYNSLPAGGPLKYNNGKYRVCFPFGYGLSYTTFNIEQPRLNKTTISKNDSADLTVKITNTGDRKGDEVVQVYMRKRYGSKVRPVRELKAFKRITLEAGETKKLTFKIGFEQLKGWFNGKWDVESGAYTLIVGTDSQSGHKTNLNVK